VVRGSETAAQLKLRAISIALAGGFNPGAPRIEIRGYLVLSDEADCSESKKGLERRSNVAEGFNPRWAGRKALEMSNLQAQGARLRVPW
jgi:hypothetical protein